MKIWTTQNLAVLLGSIVQIFSILFYTVGEGISLIFLLTPDFLKSCFSFCCLQLDDIFWAISYVAQLPKMLQYEYLKDKIMFSVGNKNQEILFYVYFVLW